MLLALLFTYPPEMMVCPCCYRYSYCVIEHEEIMLVLVWKIHICWFVRSIYNELLWATMQPSYSNWKFRWQSTWEIVLTCRIPSLQGQKGQWLWKLLHYSVISLVLKQLWHLPITTHLIVMCTCNLMILLKSYPYIFLWMIRKMVS